MIKNTLLMLSLSLLAMDVERSQLENKFTECLTDKPDVESRIASVRRIVTPLMLSDDELRPHFSNTHTPSQQARSLVASYFLRQPGSADLAEVTMTSVFMLGGENTSYSSHTRHDKLLRLLQHRFEQNPIENLAAWIRKNIRCYRPSSWYFRAYALLRVGSIEQEQSLLKEVFDRIAKRAAQIQARAKIQDRVEEIITRTDLPFGITREDINLIADGARLSNPMFRDGFRKKVLLLMCSRALYLQGELEYLNMMRTCGIASRFYQEDPNPFPALLTQPNSTCKEQELEVAQGLARASSDYLKRYSKYLVTQRKQKKQAGSEALELSTNFSAGLIDEDSPGPIESSPLGLFRNYDDFAKLMEDA